MKIIELLNKIANDEEVPKHVRYYNMIENIDDIMYVCKENIFYKLDNLQIHLNSRVEEIEEPQEHKIEKAKLDVDNDVNGTWDTVEINNIKYEINKIERYIFGKINEIIDYLEVNNDGKR